MGSWLPSSVTSDQNPFASPVSSARSLSKGIQLPGLKDLPFVAIQDETGQHPTCEGTRVDPDSVRLKFWFRRNRMAVNNDLPKIVRRKKERVPNPKQVFFRLFLEGPPGTHPCMSEIIITLFMVSMQVT